MNAITVLTTVTSVAATLAVAVGIVLAVLAHHRDRTWLVAASAVPVVVILVVGVVAGDLPAAHPAITAVLVLALAALGVIAGSPIVALVLRLATRGSVPLGIHGGILVKDSSTPAPDREILRGGATIGYLERLALIGSVAAGQAAAVAVIVAIKGLGRYSELENAQARERFIIGTLASLTWAGACAAAVLLVW